MCHIDKSQGRSDYFKDRFKFVVFTPLELDQMDETSKLDTSKNRFL